MKKIIILLIVAAVSVPVSAQKKGDMYLKGSFGISGGNTKNVNTSGGSKVTSTTPSPMSFSIAPGYGYFVSDNVKIAAELSYVLTCSPKGKDGDKQLSSFTNSFRVTPGASYYIKIADRFFYTPGVDMYLGLGNKKTQLSTSKTEKDYSTTVFGFRLNLLSCEFRASKHFAFSADFGDFGFSTTVTKNNNTSRQIANNVGLNLKSLSTSFGFQYYF